MGSVKDLEILKEATPVNPGRARFTFSDRYSVFDWGEMPDHIPHKGAAITLLGAYFFEELEKMGIPSHYVGLVEDDRVAKISEIRNPVNMMEIKLLRVLTPELRGDRYDYSVYRGEKGNFLIPLEVIYRNSLPAGSSVFTRLKDGQISPRDLSLDKMPVPDQKLDTVFLDVSTKLEITDLYLSWEEAQRISSLSDHEIEEVKKLTGAVNDLITRLFSKIGLINEDGKIEIGFDGGRRLILVDVLGTLDECRFTIDGMPVSKEIARIFYRGSSWHAAVEEAKKKDRKNWKDICELRPDPLPHRLKDLISQVYCACTNEITGREWFHGVPHLNEIVGEIRTFLQPQE